MTVSVSFAAPHRTVSIVIGIEFSQRYPQIPNQRVKRALQRRRSTNNDKIQPVFGVGRKDSFGNLPQSSPDAIPLDRVSDAATDCESDPRTPLPADPAIIDRGRAGLKNQPRRRPFSPRSRDP